GMLREKFRGLGVATDTAADELLKAAGSILIGSDGALVGNDHSTHITTLPLTKFEDLETKRPQRISPGTNIYQDWIAACRGGNSHILANFDNGGPLSELLMLGNIATLHPGETLSYDPRQGRILGYPYANEHLGFEYRNGWRI